MWPLQSLLGSRRPPQSHMRRKTPGVPGHCTSWYRPRTLCSGIHLCQKMHMHIGEGPVSNQVSEIKQGNWPKENKDPEELSYISELNHLCWAPHSGGCPRPYCSLGCTLFLCFWLKLLLFVLSHMLYYDANNNFIPVFMVFASLIHSCFQQGQESGQICF